MWAQERSTLFSVGDMVAVDADYQQQTGYVGTGIAAAYVNDPADVNRDANYVRRVTFNVGRVAEQDGDVVGAGAAVAGRSARRREREYRKWLRLWTARAGSFFQEWSALFVAEEESGGRVCFHYPRLSPTTGVASAGAVKAFAREEAVAIVAPIASLALRAGFVAMPHTDENDGQTAVCYRSYFPGAMAAVY